jgi:hypothetical protein
MTEIEKDILLTEYKELNANLRHYGSMRFAQLTLFFVATSGLVVATFLQSPPLPVSHRLLFKVIAIGLAFVFITIEESSTAHWRRFYKRIRRVEECLETDQYLSPTRMCPFLPSATCAVRCLLWANAFFWIILAALDANELMQNLAANMMP